MLTTVYILCGVICLFLFVDVVLVVTLHRLNGKIARKRKKDESTDN